MKIGDPAKITGKALPRRRHRETWQGGPRAVLRSEQDRRGEDTVKHYIRVTSGPYAGAVYAFPTKKDALALARALEKARPHSTDYGNDRDGFPETHLKGRRTQMPRRHHAIMARSNGTFGSGAGSGTHSASHADDAPSVPSASSSTGMSHAHHVATTMRDSFASEGQPTSAIKGYGDGTFSFQHIQPQMYKDNRGNIYRSRDEPGAQKADARGKLETIPEKLVSRHYSKSGAMTVTDHSKGATGTHPDEIRRAGGQIREAQPWKARR